MEYLTKLAEEFGKNKRELTFIIHRQDLSTNVLLKM